LRRILTIIIIILFFNLSNTTYENISISDKNQVFIPNALNHFATDREEKNIAKVKDSLTPSEPIIIDEDEDFISYGFNGSGTAEDPYVIESLNITTGASIGIHITGTTKHFIIRNNYINARNLGIAVGELEDFTAIITNNFCEKNTESIFMKTDIHCGIYVYYATGVVIDNNTCINNGEGISVYSSANITILYNDCSYNEEEGIYADDVSNVTIINSRCSFNEDEGILVGGNNIVLSNNYCSNNFDGIRIIPISTYVTVRDSVCKNNHFGIHIEGSKYIKINGNDCSNNFNGIYIRFHYYFGSHFSAYITISNNTCTHNDNNGIDIGGSINDTITNNRCSYNKKYGIKLESFYFHPKNITIAYNIFSRNEESGVVLSECNLCTIYGNYFDNNGKIQAKDIDGHKNKWYNKELKLGNYWSDWDGNWAYSIGNSFFIADHYPLRSDGSPTGFKPFTKAVFYKLILPVVLVTTFIVSTKIISKIKIKSKVKKSGFKTFEEYQQAINAGFTNSSDWNKALTKGFKTYNQMKELTSLGFQSYNDLILYAKNLLNEYKTLEHEFQSLTSDDTNATMKQAQTLFKQFEQLRNKFTSFRGREHLPNSLQEQLQKELSTINKIISMSDEYIKELERSQRRFKEFENIIRTYSRISLDKLATFLEFPDTLSLERWIVNLNSPIITIDGNDVIIKRKDDSTTTDTSIEEAINSLLNQFQEFEQRGHGKKE